MLKRSVLGLADQAISSLSSLIFAIMVARISAPDEVGAWAIAYALYTFSLTVSRSVLSTTALISPTSGTANVQTESVDRGAHTLSIAVGLMVGLLFVASGLVVGGPVAVYLLLFGAGTPVLLLQDTIRYTFIRRRMTHLTAVLDAVWLLVQVTSGWGLVSLIGDGRGVVIGWLAGVFVSAILGVVLLKKAFSLADAKEFVLAFRSTAVRLFVDSLVSSGTANALPILLGATLGLVATGHFRGALTLLGVVGIIVMGLTPIATVEVLPRVKDASHNIRFLILWCAGIAVLGVAVFFLLIYLPNRWGQQLLGETWFGTREILLAMSVQIVFRGPFTGVPIILRAAHRLNEVIRLRLVQGMLTLTCAMAGALFWGLAGAAWGWAAGGFAASAVSLRAFFIYNSSL